MGTGGLERFVFPLYLFGQTAVAATMDISNALADELEGAGVIKDLQTYSISHYLILIILRQQWVGMV
jgi:hypothetical protein